MKKKSNYDIFKEEALKRFLTFDQEKVITRLHLRSDSEYIYVSFCIYEYRIHRQMPAMERKDKEAWVEADTNEVLTICDLLCHTEEPISLSGDFLSLQSLNRVKSGTTSVTLGGDMMKGTTEVFDQKDEALKKACEMLGGFPAGKGDVAYEIPLYEPIRMRFSFYDSDEDFPPQMTLLFASDICRYLHYETLYYLAGFVIQTIKNHM